MNTLYIGKHHTGIEGFCDPIIPKDLFEDVQRKISLNIKKSQKRVYLFSGLIRCAECGRVFGASHRVRGTQDIKLYRCTRHYNYKPPQCANSKKISEKALEKHLLAQIKEIMRDAIIEYQIEEAPVRSQREQLATIKRKLDRLKELYVNDLISIDEYKTDKEELTMQSAALEAVQEPQKRSVGALEELLRMDIQGIYTDLTEEEKRTFWRGIIKVIWFDRERNYKVELL